MTYNKLVPVRERVIAETLGVGSKLGHYLKAPARFIGSAPNESYLSLQWRFMRAISASDYAWTELAGDSSAGRTPKNYTEAAVFSFEHESLAALFDEHGGKSAVAYVLGTSAVMVGTAEQADFFGEDPDVTANRIIAMRIGRGTLRALPGILTGQEQFMPVSGGDIHRVKVSEIPIDVPIV